jgi:hypothetical protein
MHSATVTSMRTLRTIFVAAPVAAVFFGGCNFGTPCQQVVPTSDSSQGTFSLTENGAKGSGVIPGSSSDLTLQSSAPSTVTLTGDFVDDAKNDHSFTLTFTVDSNAGSRQLGQGSSACIDNLPCNSLTGTLSVSSFSTNCMGQEECALIIVGNLDATTAWSGGTFGVKLSLNHVDSWESYACNNGQGGE